NKLYNIQNRESSVNVAEAIRLTRLGKVEILRDPPDGGFCSSLSKIINDATPDQRMTLDEQALVEHLVTHNLNAGERNTSAEFAGTRAVQE
ncbi:hypothetical protein ABTN25_19605, partial [Acinetobacter baumannii]